jgi:hypothetical protein
VRGRDRRMVVPRPVWEKNLQDLTSKNKLGKLAHNVTICDQLRQKYKKQTKAKTKRKDTDTKLGFNLFPISTHRVLGKSMNFSEPRILIWKGVIPNSLGGGRGSNKVCEAFSGWCLIQSKFKDNCFPRVK